ncbi:ELMO CED-12 family protein [Musa troglodytarum]|uniref:ELMO CED-12 family protein n=1 Tax=Musa troglodytarum TaxID=320322 RepID=A0A9E7F614_9LILI|nr:ELMO CED-12 family protein [Musa troglodytarum]
MRVVDGKGGLLVAVRRLSQWPARGSGCHSSHAEVVTGSTAWLGRGLACVCAQRREIDGRLLLNLTPSQEECLRRLQSRIVEALWALWYYAYPGVELHGLISNQWKEMGWQGKDPSTDFRKQEGVRAMWEYPFSVAGVNITFMLIQMFDLQAGRPRSMVGAIFLKLLLENERAFDMLYCITFKMMDQQWLAMHASYMDFNLVMKSTRRQLERELLLEDTQRIEDMPSYRLLKR